MLHIKKAEPSQAISDALNKAKENCKGRLSMGDVKAARNAFDNLRETKALIRESLVQEQHGLCAYCMRRIQDKPERSDEGNDYPTRIEHWQPLSKNTENALEYANMLGVCYGGDKMEEPIEPEESRVKTRRVLCCDASKGDAEITIDPRDPIQMGKIQYDEEGLFIYTAPFDRALENDINNELHLNGVRENGKLLYDTRTNLIYHRRQAYKSFQNYLKYLRDAKQTPEEMRRAIEGRIAAIENADIYPPFAGVLLYFLKRALRQYPKSLDIPSSPVCRLCSATRQGKIDNPTRP